MSIFMIFTPAPVAVPSLHPFPFLGVRGSGIAKQVARELSNTTLNYDIYDRLPF